MAVVFTLAAGGTAVSGATATGAAGQSVAAQSVQTRVTNSRSAARRGQTTEAWGRMGLRVVTRAANREIRQELECATASSGQVREFLNRTPCQSLRRTQAALCDEHGNNITMSVAWVRMPNPVSAEQLKRLVDRNGTGSVTTSRGIRFTGKHYSSRRTGSLVVIAEATGGQAGSAMLDGVTEVAAEFPDPQ